MSSPGQIIGGILGAVVGLYAGGNVVLGASIGMAIGGAIDPPKGPHIQGPRLDDKTIQTSSYGEVIPIVYGTTALHGNVFWVENNSLKETAVKEESGGKGGSTSEVTTYTYYATFAVAICMGPIKTIKRVWIGPTLVYDGGTEGIDAQISQGNGGFIYDALSNVVGIWMPSVPGSPSFYYGTDTQLPDARMEATLGIGNVPAYRGVCYVVFNDLPLADYGNTLMGAQIKVEVVMLGSTTPVYAMAESYKHYPPQGNNTVTNDVHYGPRVREVGVHYRANPLSDTYKYSYYGEDLDASYGLLSAASGYSALGYRRSFDIDGMSYHIKSGNMMWYNGAEYIYPAALSTEHLGFGANFGMQKLNDGLYVVSYSYHNGNSQWGYMKFALGSGVVTILNTVFFPYYHGEPATTGNLGLFNIFGDKLACWEHVSYGPYAHRVIITTFDDALDVDGTYFFPATTVLPITVPTNGSGYVQRNGRGNLWKQGNKVYVLRNTSVSAQAWQQLMICNLDTLTYEFYNLDNKTVYAPSFDPHIFRVFDGGVIQFSRPCYAFNYETSLHTYIYHPSAAVQSNPVTLASIVSHLCLKSRLDVADIDVSELASDYVRGYTVASVGTLRAAIEPLSAVWPFDVITSGYKIKFVRRPKTPVVTIQEMDLVASTEGQSTARLSEVREMDGQLPQRLSVRYADVNREYDVSVQYEERLATSSVNQRVLDLPIVLASGEAANAAQQLLYRAWVERSTFAFTLPPAVGYLKLEPADVVAVQTNTATHEILLREIVQHPDGRIECKGQRNASAAYSPTAVGVDGSAVQQEVSWQLTTAGLLLDIPQVHTDHGSTAILAAMRSTGGWAGASLMMTRDSGESWATIGALGAGQESTIGTCLTQLSSGSTTAMVDASTVLTVKMKSGELASVSRAQLLNGANHFAIGASGRWEILQAQTCTLTGPDTYKLSNFLRGRFGTEWAVGTHQLHDDVVFLDPNRIAWGGLRSTDFDMPYPWRFVTKGQAIDSATNVTGTYTGVNLECLSPVKPRTYKNAAGDLIVNWKRRTRFDGQWLNRVDVPLNETVEKYDVVVWSDGTRTTAKRTFSNLPSTTCTYAIADQTTDWGGSIYNAYATVYQLSELRGRGAGLNFLIEGIDHDPYWSSVSVLCHCDGDDGSSVLVDEKGHTLTAGKLVLGTGFKRFGKSSMKASPTSPYYYPGWSFPVDASVSVGTGAFTIEGWVYHLGTLSKYMTLCYSGTSTGDYDIFVSVVGNGTAAGIYFGSKNVSNANNTQNGGASIVPINQWVHVRICRSGNSLYFFVNFALVATRALPAGWNIRSNGPNFYVGAGTTTYRMEGGYVDEFRFTKGIARSTASFPSILGPFPHE